MDNFNAKLVQKEYEENYKIIRKRKVEDQKEFIIGCIKEACKEGRDRVKVRELYEEVIEFLKEKKFFVKMQRGSLVITWKEEEQSSVSFLIFLNLIGFVVLIIFFSFIQT